MINQSSFSLPIVLIMASAVESVEAALSSSTFVKVMLVPVLLESQSSLFGDWNSCLRIPLLGVFLVCGVSEPELQSHFLLFTCTDKIVQLSVV